MLMQDNFQMCTRWQLKSKNACLVTCLLLERIFKHQEKDCVDSRHYLDCHTQQANVYECSRFRILLHEIITVVKKVNDVPLLLKPFLSMFCLKLDLQTVKKMDLDVCLMKFAQAKLDTQLMCYIVSDVAAFCMSSDIRRKQCCAQINNFSSKSGNSFCIKFTYEECYLM